MTSPIPKKVLILAASLGSGHLRAAEATASALRAVDPRCHVEVLDIRALVSPAFRLLQFHGYEFLIEHVPWVWRILYQSPLFRHKKYAAPKFLLTHGNRRLVDRVRQFSPNVIVSTQINCHELAYFLSEPLATKPRRIAIVTDYDGHPIWSKIPAHLLVVGHEQLVRALRNVMTGSSLEALGIPIDAAFQAPQDRAALRTRFGLCPDVATLLVMGGSVGFGEIDRVVADLLRFEWPVQILAVAGKNEAVRRRLEALQKRLDSKDRNLSASARNTLHVFGFVDFVPELMTLADCFITKPGGLATTEALVKGLPMVFINPIAGHEEKNARFFVNHGVAMTAGKISQLRPTLNLLFADQRKRLNEMREATKALAKPGAARRLAEKILEAATD